MANDDVIIIENCSKQLVSLQVRPPKSDFFTGEQQVRLFPNKSIELPKKYFNMSQVENCAARGLIRTVSGA